MSDDIAPTQHWLRRIFGRLADPLGIKGADGATIVSASNRLPVDASVSVTLGEVEIKNDTGNPVPVSGTVALDASTLAALEIIGLDAATLAALENVGITNFPAGYPDAAVLAKVEAVRALLAAGIAVTGPLTDAQLRAAAIAVSAASLPLPAGAATSAKQDTLLTELQAKADLTETQPVSLAAALPAGTNAIGKLAANSGVDIGDVDVTSLPKRAITPSPYFANTASPTVAKAIVTPGNALRLYAYSASADPENSAKVIASLRFGAGGADFVTVPLSQYGGVMSHSFIKDGFYVTGGADIDLYSSLGAAQGVYWNFTIEEVAP